jgi:polyisoprenoid-binding protein YceI
MSPMRVLTSRGSFKLVRVRYLNRNRSAMAAMLALATLMGACRSRESAQPPASSQPEPAPRAALKAGVHTFVIVPEQSKASYHASEEFFPSALERLGITAGKAEAVGTTQAVEGRFQLDPERPSSATPGENTFTVRVNTLTSNQRKRDDYVRQVRDDGPSFDAHPQARFTAVAIAGSSTPNASGRELSFTLTGDLTVREITRREVFAVKAQLTGDVLAGIATTRFLLSDFGIGPIDFPPLLAVADPIAIEIQFTARAEPE